MHSSWNLSGRLGGHKLKCLNLREGKFQNKQPWNPSGLLSGRTQTNNLRELFFNTKNCTPRETRLACSVAASNYCKIQWTRNFRILIIQGMQILIQTNALLVKFVWLARMPQASIAETKRFCNTRVPKIQSGKQNSKQKIALLVKFAWPARWPQANIAISKKICNTRIPNVTGKNIST